MVHEISQLKKSKETNELRYERYNYIAELINDINKYNDVLTQWIKLQQGELSLHIESFSLQQIFDIVAKSRMSFQLKGITLKYKRNTMCSESRQSAYFVYAKHIGRKCT